MNIVEIVAMRIISHKGIIIKNKFLDTNLLWIEISILLGILAVTFHLSAEFFGLYDVTNVDVYTHFMSSFALISLLLNLNLTRSRKIYWGIPVVMAFILGLLWEVSEDIFIISGLFPWIQNEFWNAIQDLFMDILGGIVAGFFVDKVVE